MKEQITEEQILLSRLHTFAFAKLLDKRRWADFIEKVGIEHKDYDFSDCWRQYASDDFLDWFDNNIDSHENQNQIEKIAIYLMSKLLEDSVDWNDLCNYTFDSDRDLRREYLSNVL